MKVSLKRHLCIDALALLSPKLKMVEFLDMIFSLNTFRAFLLSVRLPVNASLALRVIMCTNSGKIGFDHLTDNPF